MTYSTLMAHLEFERSNARLLQVAGDPAQRFEASVIGIAACQPMQLLYGEGTYVSGHVFEQDRVQEEAETNAAEAEFRAAFQGGSGFMEWRSTVTYALLSVSIDNDAGRLSAIAQNKAADLVIAGAYGHNRVYEWAFGRVTRDLLLRADRSSLLSH